jgi:MbtH-like protein
VNPFDDDNGSFFVLVNDGEQHSPWPTFADIPDGWPVVYGEALRVPIREVRANVRSDAAEEQPRHTRRDGLLSPTSASSQPRPIRHCDAMQRRSRAPNVYNKSTFGRQSRGQDVLSGIVNSSRIKPVRRCHAFMETSRRSGRECRTGHQPARGQGASTCI